MVDKSEDAGIEYTGKYNELFYSYDQEGQYDKRVGVHDNSDTLFINQFWEVSRERIEKIRQKAIAGEISPVAYYMEKNLLDPLSLSMQTGISLWRVKRHFKPLVFRRLSDTILQKYAQVFMISVEQLKRVE